MRGRVATSATAPILTSMKLTYSNSFNLLTHEETKGQKALRYLYELIAILLLLAITPVIIYTLAEVGREILNHF